MESTQKPIKRMLMDKKHEKPRRGRTPISESLCADLNDLGKLLANHTRGLDAYLQKQGRNINERQATLISESADLKLQQGIDLNHLSKTKLQELCREQGFRGWSKLCKAELHSFIERELSIEIDALEKAHTSESFENNSSQDSPLQFIYPADSSRPERLLLLLLRQLGTSKEDIEVAWHSPQGS